LATSTGLVSSCATPPGALPDPDVGNPCLPELEEVLGDGAEGNLLGDDEIEAGIIPGKTTDKEHGAIERHHDLVVSSIQRGKKTVGTVRSLEMNGVPYVWGHRVAGYIESPYKQRIVVVVRYEHRGYEGPPNTTSFDLFGASLNVGFKR